ncbi:MAG: hypothetical protein HY722_00790, partial [Planctomycetes bacterium]|nr:hypothetical protein [Planctomycetota bacterium]
MEAASWRARVVQAEDLLARWRARRDPGDRAAVVEAYRGLIAEASGLVEAEVRFDPDAQVGSTIVILKGEGPSAGVEVIYGPAAVAARGPEYTREHVLPREARRGRLLVEMLGALPEAALARALGVVARHYRLVGEPEERTRIAARVLRSWRTRFGAGALRTEALREAYRAAWAGTDLEPELEGEAARAAVLAGALPADGAWDLGRDLTRRYEGDGGPAASWATLDFLESVAARFEHRDAFVLEGPLSRLGEPGLASLLEGAWWPDRGGELDPLRPLEADAFVLLESPGAGSQGEAALGLGTPGGRRARSRRDRGVSGDLAPLSLEALEGPRAPRGKGRAPAAGRRLGLGTSGGPPVGGAAQVSGWGRFPRALGYLASGTGLGLEAPRAGRQGRAAARRHGPPAPLGAAVTLAGLATASPARKGPVVGGLDPDGLAVPRPLAATGAGRAGVRLHGLGAFGGWPGRIARGGAWREAAHPLQAAVAAARAWGHGAVSTRAPGVRGFDLPLAVPAARAMTEGAPLAGWAGGVGLPPRELRRLQAVLRGTRDRAGRPYTRRARTSSAGSVGARRGGVGVGATPPRPGIEEARHPRPPAGVPPDLARLRALGAFGTPRAGARWKAAPVSGSPGPSAPRGVTSGRAYPGSPRLSRAALAMAGTDLGAVEGLDLARRDLWPSVVDRRRPRPTRSRGSAERVGRPGTREAGGRPGRPLLARLACGWPALEGHEGLGLALLGLRSSAGTRPRSARTGPRLGTQPTLPRGSAERVGRPGTREAGGRGPAQRVGRPGTREAGGRPGGPLLGRRTGARGPGFGRYRLMGVSGPAAASPVWPEAVHAGVHAARGGASRYAYALRPGVVRHPPRLARPVPAGLSGAHASLQGPYAVEDLGLAKFGPRPSVGTRLRLARTGPRLARSGAFLAPARRQGRPGGPLTPRRASGRGGLDASVVARSSGSPRFPRRTGRGWVGAGGGVQGTPRALQALPGLPPRHGPGPGWVPRAVAGRWLGGRFAPPILSGLAGTRALRGHAGHPGKPGLVRTSRPRRPSLLPRPLGGTGRGFPWDVATPRGTRAADRSGPPAPGTAVRRITTRGEAVEQGQSVEALGPREAAWGPGRVEPPRGRAAGRWPAATTPWPGSPGPVLAVPWAGLPGRSPSLGLSRASAPGQGWRWTQALPGRTSAPTSHGRVATSRAVRRATGGMTPGRPSSRRSNSSGGGLGNRPPMSPPRRGGGA